MFNRYAGGLITGILMGAAVGAFWATQADRKTQQRVMNQGMQVARAAKRTARAVQTSASRLNPALRAAGRSMMSAAVGRLR